MKLKASGRVVPFACPVAAAATGWLAMAACGTPSVDAGASGSETSAHPASSVHSATSVHSASSAIVGGGGARAAVRIGGDERLARKPVLAVVTSGGQQLGTHAGPPPFVLFDDRRVVARRTEGVVEGVVEGELARDAYDSLLAEVAGSGLAALPSRIAGGVEATHSLDTSILVREGEAYRRVRVVGFHDGAMQASPTPRAPPPEAFVRVYETLTSLPIPGARPWIATHALAIWSRVERADEAWPASVPLPDAGCFRPAGDESLLHCVVERAVATPLAEAYRAPGPRPAFRSNQGAYALAHFGESIEARAFLERIDQCADSEALRDRACELGP